MNEIQKQEMSNDVILKVENLQIYEFSLDTYVRILNINYTQYHSYVEPMLP